VSAKSHSPALTLLQVREGFIVDDEDDDAGEGEEVRRIARRKRRREQREREEALDADDLEVIGIRASDPEDDETQVRQSGLLCFANCGQPKFKRLKQGHREVRREMFSDDEDDLLDDERLGAGMDEMAGFIEDDQFSDEDDLERMRDEREVARPGRLPFSIDKLTAGLDEASLEDYRAAFGNGDEYQWALDLEEQEEEEREAERGTGLQDMFEPGQLAEKLLTPEDLEIRMKDVPERLQIARQGLITLKDEPGHEGELLQEESDWISDLLLAQKRYSPELQEYFRKAVTNVLRFLNEDNLEVPYIEQHRHDYIIHSYDNDGRIEVITLVKQAELWKILELDLRFRAFVEKRLAVKKSYTRLGQFAGVTDATIDEMLPKAAMMEEIQDLQDYLNFQYSGELKDAHAADTEAANGTHRRPRTGKNQWEAMRSSNAYGFVRAVGITAEAFAHNALGTGARTYTEDATERPDALADSLLQPPEFSTSAQVLRVGKQMFVEELVNNPRMRQFMRKTFFQMGVIDCIRTDKGRFEITEDHRYYDFKYLRNLEFSSVARKPELFLRMIKAESEGLVTIQFRILNQRSFRQKLYSLIESDSFSAVADEWNAIRRELIDLALEKLSKIISRGVQDALRQECESTMASTCREKLLYALDQAAYRAPGLEFGEKPTVLALSSGRGVHNRDAICWIYMDVQGYVKESGKFNDIRMKSDLDKTPPGADNAKFIDLVVRQKPDVIAVSGFSVETRKNASDFEEILKEHEEITNAGSEAQDLNKEKQFVRPDVVVVNDEVARLYYNSDRASVQFPHLPPLGRYCVALARYLRNPLLEFSSLGNDITSIVFDRNQDLLPRDKLLRALESAIVDITNVSGVNLEDAMFNPYVGVSLQYVAGLGPRKALRLLETIKLNVCLHCASIVANYGRAALLQAEQSWSVTRSEEFLRPWDRSFGTTAPASSIWSFKKTSRPPNTSTTHAYTQKTMSLLEKYQPTLSALMRKTSWTRREQAERAQLSAASWPRSSRER
jgi:transcription elongation factor SPT6